MADESYKLKVQIGSAAFEAEGPKATVEKQFQMFLEAVHRTPLPPALPPDQSKGSGSGHDELPRDQLLGRVFRDKDDDLSLRTLPNTENRNLDTLLLLLWGYYVLKEESTIPASTLIAAANQSGLQLDRVDRVLNSAVQYVRSGGMKKGKRYMLTNPGVTYAQELAQAMLQ